MQYTRKLFVMIPTGDRDRTNYCCVYISNE